MFEIGNSLREARRRQGFALDDIAATTLIRRRYLEALEEERFDLLPDGFYRRGFLRRYADYLGLDGEAFVEEYDLRESHSAPPALSNRPVRRASAADVAYRLRVPAAALALSALIAIAVWQLASSSGSGRVRGSVAKTPAATTPAHGATRHAHHRTSAPKVVVTHHPVKAPVLVLKATRGACWISAQLGSAQGATVLTETLEPGQSARFTLRHTLFLRFGAPRNLDATINGRPVSSELPAGTGDALATQSGRLTTP